jgi:exosortase/archaeosortase family protein
MTVPMFGVLVIGLLSGAVGSFLLAVYGFKTGKELYGRGATVGGFVVFTVILVVGMVQYWITGRPYRYIAIPVAATGVVLCAGSVRLVLERWSRTEQLATVMAAFFVLLLPSDLFFPQVHIFAQEWFTRATVDTLALFGAEATVDASASGNFTLVCLSNGACFQITRECNAIYVGALLSAFPLGARTSMPKKIGGLAFVAVATGVTNLFRLVIIGLTMANDWFGPLVTDGNTVMISYYFAELVLNQFIIGGATVAGFLLLDRWIPDVLDFVAELLSEMRDL